MLYFIVVLIILFVIIKFMLQPKLIKSELEQDLWQKLSINFGITGFYWFPLNGENNSIAEYFAEDVFIKQNGLQYLSEILKTYSTQIYELSEVTDVTPINIEEFLEYQGNETIYCDENVNWVIYFSHENTVTIAGEDLLKRLKSSWLNWKEYSNPWNV
jgi:hypothetical protein